MSEVNKLKLVKISKRMQFGSTPDEMDDLAQKVITGEKTATSSLWESYQRGLKKQSRVGDRFAILDGRGREVAVVMIERVELLKFGDITEDFARQEGDGNLANWLAIHRPYYSRLLAEMGQDLTDDTVLVCEWFRRVD